MDEKLLNIFKFIILNVNINLKNHIIAQLSSFYRDYQEFKNFKGLENYESG